MLTLAAVLIFTVICLALGADAWSKETSPERNALVFEGRNQAYGAYRLRREYADRAAVAILAAVGLCAASFILPWALLRHAASPPPIPPMDGYVLRDAPEFFVVPPATAPKAPETTSAAPLTKPVPDPAGPVEAVDSAAVPLPPVHDTPDGPPATGSVPGSGTDGPGGGTRGVGLPGLGGLDSLWNDFQVQEVPQFPGGELAMQQWVQRNLEFPDGLGRSDLVYVQFVVGADGSIESARAVKGAIPDAKASAERVVRRMPRWKPARMNGHAVRCRLTLPIRFEVR